MGYDKKNVLLNNIEEIVEIRTKSEFAPKPSSEDLVNHPKHYTGDIECIDVIKQQFGVDGLIKFCLGNAMKYVFRCEHKGTTKMDLEKAVWYLNKAIANL